MRHEGLLAESRRPTIFFCKKNLEDLLHSSVTPFSVRRTKANKILIACVSESIGITITDELPFIDKTQVRKK